MTFKLPKTPNLEKMEENTEKIAEKMNKANEMYDNAESAQVAKLQERKEKSFVPKLNQEIIPSLSYPEYNLFTKRLSYMSESGKRTDLDYNAIFYRGHHIAFRHKNFYPYPHEQVLQTIDPQLEELGLINRRPSKEQSTFRMAYGKNKYADVESNFKSVGGVRVPVSGQVRANYVFKAQEDKFDVTGNGDFVIFGATLENGIDGHLSLRIIPFSEREVCTNGMTHQASAIEISENIVSRLRNSNADIDFEKDLAMKGLKEIMEKSKNFDDLTHAIKNERQVHLKKFPTAWVRSRMYLVKESANDFKESYRKMTDMIITQKQAEQLARAMPKRMLDKLGQSDADKPSRKKIGKWMDVKTETVEERINGEMVQKEKTIVNLVPNTNQWDAFNDMTWDLTHNGRAFASRSKHYHSLDTILVPRVRRQ